MGLNRQLEIAQGMRNIELDLFTYVADFNTLLAVTTTPILVPITADSDFVLDGINLAAYSAVGVFVPNPDYLMLLRDTGSGRDLQDNPVHVGNITGSGQLAYYLPEPKLFKGAANIGITLQNLTAFAARVHVSFIGRKIFYLRGFNRDQLFSL